ncbi:MAG: hypothetical protein M3405_14035 [Acidobacteriota bacterium]|jgi:hypothetical protein|nr:hypothetical protein [Acidobacteriota bacterium]
MNEKYFSFRETPDFTKRLVKLMSDDDFAEFQMLLIANPNLGNSKKRWIEEDSLEVETGWQTRWC